MSVSQDERKRWLEEAAAAEYEYRNVEYWQQQGPINGSTLIGYSQLASVYSRSRRLGHVVRRLLRELDAASVGPTDEQPGVTGQHLKSIIDSALGDRIRGPEAIKQWALCTVLTAEEAEQVRRRVRIGQSDDATLSGRGYDPEPWEKALALLAGGRNPA